MSRPTACCRICGNRNLVKMLDLGRQALTGRFPLPEEPDPLKGPLELVVCQGDPRACCGLLQLRHSYPLEEMYGATYGYRSSNNATMVEHLRRKVERLVALASPRPGDGVLDIGSNDGTLLKFYEGLGVRRFGVDPSSVGFAGEYPDDATLLVDFFSAPKLRPYLGDTPLKIVTSIAMLYDLDAPLDFIEEVRSLLAPDGVWEFEQGYMPLLLERLAYDTVCHEHLSYFGLRQIKWMLDRSGLKILDVEVNDANGGSFSVKAARQEAPYPVATNRIEALLAHERLFGPFSLEPYRAFARRVAEHRDKLRDFFRAARRAGKLVLGYGASTKGNVILQYCGLTSVDLPAIAEKYSLKFGRVTPGSRIPIISEAEARNLAPDYFLVLPWYYRHEILEREARFVERGASLVFPLPELSVAGKPVEAEKPEVMAPSHA
jgi:NDP-4-keto-2,6-dideoxyhexose 3-C-methyltransferase